MSVPTISSLRRRRGVSVLAVVAAMTLMTVASLAPAADAAGPTPARSYLAPVEPFAVVHLFDPPAQPWLAGHRGVDVTAPEGAGVRAPAGGVVTFVGTVVDRGVLTIAHHDGLRSSFEPVRTDLSVGDTVLAGQVVAYVTAERSHCDARCVHWGVRDGDMYVNPLDTLADFGRVRLISTRPLPRRGLSRTRRSPSGSRGAS